MKLWQKSDYKNAKKLLPFTFNTVGWGRVGHLPPNQRFIKQVVFYAHSKKNVSNFFLSRVTPHVKSWRRSLHRKKSFPATRHSAPNCSVYIWTVPSRLMPHLKICSSLRSFVWAMCSSKCCLYSFISWCRCWLSIFLTKNGSLFSIDRWDATLVGLII